MSEEVTIDEINELLGDEWVEVGGVDAEMWNYKEEYEKAGKPVSIQGIYISREENQGQKGNSTIHYLETENGNKKFWGSAVLDDRLRSVEFGEAVKIVYTGKKQGKLSAYHDFKVFRKKK